MLTWMSNTYYFMLALAESACRATSRLVGKLAHSGSR